MNRQKNRRSSPLQRRATARPLGLVGAASSQKFPLALSRLGPIGLSICSVVLISLMAILYLSQLGQVVSTNQQIQDLHNQQTELQRQNNDLINTIAQEQAPAYIAAHAKAQGLQPVDPQMVQIVVLPPSQGTGNGNQSEP